MDCIKKEKAIVNTNTIGYVPQQAWIQNKTLRDNILFGKNFNNSYYNKTIEACEIVDDLKLLNAGDMTEIGEKVKIKKKNYIFFYILNKIVKIFLGY